MLVPFLDGEFVNSSLEKMGETLRLFGVPFFEE